jgi:hypothetical protein
VEEAKERFQEIQGAYSGHHFSISQFIISLLYIQITLL